MFVRKLLSILAIPALAACVRGAIDIPISPTSTPAPAVASIVVPMPTSAIPPASPTPPAGATATIAVASSATPALAGATATSINVTAIPPIHPALVKVCPSNPAVPLAKLGLDPASRLLLVPEQSEAYWDQANWGLFVASSGAAIPRRITALRRPDQINSVWYRISPNGQWGIFQRKPDGAERGAPWISSIDGARQWLLSSDERLESGIWLDDNTVLLSGEDESFKEVLDPFMMWREDLTDLPTTQIYGIGSQFIRSAGHTYLIYESGEDYRLFEAGARSDVSILQWLRNDQASLLDKGVVVRPGGNLIIQVDRPYGFDQSAALSVADLLASASYSETMHPVIFPSEILTASSTNGYSSDNTEMVVVGVSHSTTDNTFWLDFTHEVLKDFCFESAYETVAAGISPDNKFLAFTWLHLPHTQPIPKTTYILSLETGYYSAIDHFEFMAWGQASQ